MGKYAVIRTGGKQYVVVEGKELEVEKMEGEQGTKVEFEEVLLVSDGEKTLIGQPVVKNAKVTAEIKGQVKGKKIRVFKFRAKSRYRRTQGHRQLKTAVKINKIIV